MFRAATGEACDTRIQHFQREEQRQKKVAFFCSLTSKQIGSPAVVARVKGDENGIIMNPGGDVIWHAKGPPHPGFAGF